MPNVKNILFIMCDQLRWDYLSCYGHPKLETPHIDSLAARGVRFDRAYCQSPVCGSSRMSFYTGRYVNSHGASWNFVPLRVGEMTIGDHLRPRGIRTALVGKTHMRADYAGLIRLGVDLDSQEGVFAAECGFEPFERDDGIHPSSSHDPFPRYNDYLREQGFGGDNPWEDWANSAEGPNGEILSGWYLENAKFPARIPAEHSETAYITGRAIDFIDEAGAEPWCLHLSYIKPHWPYMAPAPYATLYGPEDTYPPVRSEDERKTPHPVYGAFVEQRVSQSMSRDEVRNSVLPAYMGMIKQIDDEIGRLLRFMEKLGRIEDTLIAFTSDHGDYLGDHWLGEKDLFHEPSVRIPLIVVDPSSEADATRGSVNNDLVEAIDLAPTFVDVTGGYQQPHIFDGRSLSPLLHGATPADWRTYVISEYDYAFTDPRHALGVPPSECWLRMIYDGRYKYVVCERFRPMLFDLETDPQEFVDLGDNPAYATERNRLDKLLLEWALKPRQRVTIADGTLNSVDVQRNISEAGILIGYYDEADRAAAWENWEDRPIFATFNPVWAKAQKKLRGET
ncbi:MAG: alkaline phosphatase family protein [Rhodospirillales bacterium]|nr:alkaline phosphatase family protein [Rhodospirillales bacterium]